MHATFLKFALAMALPAASAETAWPQDYPIKPIRIITFAPGGGTDFAARVIAQGLHAQAGRRKIKEKFFTAGVAIVGNTPEQKNSIQSLF